MGEEVLKVPANSRMDITGFLHAMERCPDAQILPVVNMFANPSGPVTEDVYDFVTGALLRTIRKKGPFDGVMILFHGAMVAQGHPDAEGDILELLREQLGWEIPDLKISLSAFGRAKL